MRNLWDILGFRDRNEQADARQASRAARTRLAEAKASRHRFARVALLTAREREANQLAALFARAVGQPKDDM